MPTGLPWSDPESDPWGDIQEFIQARRRWDSMGMSQAEDEIIKEHGPKMIVKVQFVSSMNIDGAGPTGIYENVTEVDDTGGAFKMRWEAEGPGWIDTAIPWRRIESVEVQRGYDE